MVSKSEYKNELIKSVKTIKAMNNYEFVDEDNLFSLLDQLAEALFESQIDSSENPGQKIFRNHEIRNSLREEKDRALLTLLLHKGSFI
ncbi:MAG: hypothetical protein KAS63_03125 [Candidatus Heimdallarchaeota archaeon]|nr:hypothetical protein [Candidatus Heimdallarchaeota archaeon]MCK4954329.1 hypothetical protein [Candidatus Heimdallarchaeota archaeon]